MFLLGLVINLGLWRKFSAEINSQMENLPVISIGCSPFVWPILVALCPRPLLQMGEHDNGLDIALPNHPPKVGKSFRQRPLCGNVGGTHLVIAGDVICVDVVTSFFVLLHFIVWCQDNSRMIVCINIQIAILCSVNITKLKKKSFSTSYTFERYKNMRETDPQSIFCMGPTVTNIYSAFIYSRFETRFEIPGFFVSLSPGFSGLTLPLFRGTVVYDKCDIVMCLIFTTSLKNKKIIKIIIVYSSIGNFKISALMNYNSYPRNYNN